MSSGLRTLARGLIVSVQAYADSVLDTPEAIALLARCAVANGAVGVRIEGSTKIAAVRAAVDVPIIGIIKRTHPGAEPYITSTLAEIDEVAAAGADIAAFDATQRPPRRGDDGARPRRAPRMPRACSRWRDCADADDLASAADAGADIIATTLAGYTAATRGRSLPALDLVRAATRFPRLRDLRRRHRDARRSRPMRSPPAPPQSWVGTAITNVDALVRAFVAASVVTGKEPRAV